MYTYPMARPSLPACVPKTNENTCAPRALYKGARGCLLYQPGSGNGPPSVDRTAAGQGVPHTVGHGSAVRGQLPADAAARRGAAGHHAEGKSWPRLCETPEQAKGVLSAGEQVAAAGLGAGVLCTRGAQAGLPFCTWAWRSLAVCICKASSDDTLKRALCGLQLSNTGSASYRKGRGR